MGMKAIAVLALGMLATAEARAQTQTQGVQSCVRSKFGADDEIGALNNITAEQVAAAARLVKRGKAIRLGIETNRKTPAFPPRTFAVTTFTPSQEDGRAFGANKFNYIDDMISGWVGVGSQLDGLGHAGIDNVFYNCTRAKDFLKADGITKFGIEKLPAIATRAVILDMVALLGKDPVPEGTTFNRAEIEAALKKQNLAINKGDVVIFYTGWTKLIGKDDKRYATGEPGLGIDGARYLASLNVAMVGADTWGLDAVPFEDPNVQWRVHQILLTENGIYIIENVNTEEAVKDGVYEGLFTLGPARITGAVQAIINPVLLY